jgi:hypothetical protein
MLLRKELMNGNFWNMNGSYILLWFAVGNIIILDKLKELLIATFEYDIAFTTRNELPDIKDKIKKFMEYKI